MTPTSPTVRPLALACALLALSSAACKEEKVEAGPQRPPGEAWLSPQQLSSGQIVTAPVEEREVGGEITTSGKVAFDDLRVAHVFSPVSGRVVEISAHPGQKVARGAPLAIIDSPDLGSALADVDKAEADLIAAKHELDRQTALVEAQAGARRDLEAATDNERKARAEVQRAKARTRLLHGGAEQAESVQGQRYILRAPIGGEVISRAVNPGVEVQGQYGGGTAVELFTIGSIDQVWILADVFETDLAKVVVGAALSASVPAYEGRSFTGRVDWISPALDPATRTARVRCVLKNDKGELRPEMYATVRIATGVRSSLAIPRAAVLRQGEQTWVFTQLGRTEHGMLRFTRKQVQVDDAGGELLPVVSGLARGETVVTAGAIQLSGIL
jgi:cobalt-zinc-cadmium efflux system membrane fusion protein